MPAVACLGQDPYRALPPILALERESPRAAFEWGWQWVFPATRFYHHAASGQRRRRVIEAHRSDRRMGCCMRTCNAIAAGRPRYEGGSTS